MSKLQDMHMHQCYSPGLENFEEKKSAHSKGKKKAIMVLSQNLCPSHQHILNMWVVLDQETIGNHLSQSIEMPTELVL